MTHLLLCGNAYSQIIRNLKERTININHAMTYYPRRDDTYKCEFKESLPKTDAGVRNLPMMKSLDK